MANSGVRGGSGTNGSQFFIIFGPTLQLDGLNPDGSPKPCDQRGVSCHAVFGKVIEGMDAVDKIKKAPAGSQSGTVDDPDKIIRMRVKADIKE